MEQVEMNNMYVNIDVNKSSEKCTEKTPRPIRQIMLQQKMDNSKSKNSKPKI